MTGLSSSCSGSESVYGRFKMFVLLSVGYSVVVSKFNFFFDL
jgi:hypothetical protein